MAVGLSESVPSPVPIAGSMRATRFARALRSNGVAASCAMSRGMDAGRQPLVHCWRRSEASVARSRRNRASGSPKLSADMTCWLLKTARCGSLNAAARRCPAMLSEEADCIALIAAENPHALAFRATAICAAHSTHGLWFLPGRNPADASGGVRGLALVVDGPWRFNRKRTRQWLCLISACASFLEAGVHFGHQTHRWNPKMAPYIYGARNNIHIIDLSQTVPLLHQALKTGFRHRRHAAAACCSSAPSARRPTSSPTPRSVRPSTMSTRAGSAAC